jgi:hypothetical protein
MSGNEWVRGNRKGREGRIGGDDAGVVSSLRCVQDVGESLFINKSYAGKIVGNQRYVNV